MPLSEYEQRVLEQMERALTSDDPRLANTLQTAERPSVWRYVIGFSAALVGLFLLVLGVALPQVALGIVGFLLMLGGVAYAVLRRPARRGPSGIVAEDGTVRDAAGARNGRRTPAAKPARRSFLARMEERWDRRRDQR